MTESISIPGYRIERKLGQGGMAAVYLAIQQSFEREVALKVMSPLLNSDPSFTTRFMREARIVAHIHHASIVPVFDVGEHLPYHYLSMEYLPGGDLKQRILQGQCGTQLAYTVCMALSAALDLAHRKGFVHRDIKPENILFREDGTPVLTDFGIARAVDSGTSLTVAGMLVGTPSYMSPEQVKGQELDGRSDLYSLGIVCYEMLTGTVPFRADSTLSVALKHLSEPLPKLPPHVASYQTFLDRLTAKERDERYASGVEVVHALRQLGDGGQMPLPSFVPAPEHTLMRSLTASEQKALAGATPAPRSPTPAPTRVATQPPKPAAPAKPPREPLLARLKKIPWPGLPSISWRMPARRWALWVGAVALLLLAVGIAFMTGSGSPPGAQSTNTLVADGAIQTQNVPIPAAAETAPATNDAADEATDPAAADDDPPAETQTASVQDEVAAAQARAAAQAAARKRTEDRRRQQEERKLQEAAKLAEEQRARQDQIASLLAEAKTFNTQGAYDTASERYRSVLKLQPDQQDALAGVQRIANMYVDEALRAVAVHDPSRARQYIDLIRNVQPAHQKLAELEQTVAQLEANPAERTKREQKNLERANAAMTEAYAQLDRAPLDVRMIDKAASAYDNAVRAMPQAPGLGTLKERLIGVYTDAVRGALASNDTKRAKAIMDKLAKRAWMNPELEQLADSMKPGGGAVPAPVGTTASDSGGGKP